MAQLVFLDTETTGLNPRKHHVWEIAYAVEDGPITAFQVPHTLMHADTVALKLNGYLYRVHQALIMSDADSINPHSPSVLPDVIKFRDAVQGNHIVGSNPAFDAAFIEKYLPYRETLWHHRKIDIASMAMPIFNWSRPKGMANIIDKLNELGFDIQAPDHTAAGDVQVLREVYKALTGDLDYLKLRPSQPLN